MNLNITITKELVRTSVREINFRSIYSREQGFQVLAVSNDVSIKYILIASVEGFPGFKEALNAIYPYTRIQRGIVYQVMNTLKFLS